MGGGLCARSAGAVHALCASRWNVDTVARRGLDDVAFPAVLVERFGRDPAGDRRGVDEIFVRRELEAQVLRTSGFLRRSAVDRLPLRAGVLPPDLTTCRLTSVHSLDLHFEFIISVATWIGFASLSQDLMDQRFATDTHFPLRSET